MPAPAEAAQDASDPEWRPQTLTDVYTSDGIRRIVGWFEEMSRYESNDRSKSGGGMRRPNDLVLGDSFVQP